MKKYIIKTAGKMSDIIHNLNTLQAIYGKDATFSDIMKVNNFITLHHAIKKQFERGAGKCL